MKSKLALVLSGVCVAFVVLHGSNHITQKANAAAAASGNWVSIPYGKLVDRTKLTHSGDTVGDVIKKIPVRGDAYKGLVQQYLEPYSYLCQDKLQSFVAKDIPPLVNITKHYPVGSEQPAWVALFREGHFQLYYNADLIRVFLKGSDPKKSFEKYRSVIRHPIRDVINTKGASIKKIEVYVFKNDYAGTKLSLNTVPAVYDAHKVDLSSERKSLDLDSIEEFFKSGVILEAMEVDKNNNLLFYGKRSSGQTIAGQPISISDIAVVYRSIFHSGYNSPYISLDKNEDNRYAKVNFGGLLGNTRVGKVVLEADKLFKMLTTGINPNTHSAEKENISKFVPGFLTENERSFLNGYPGKKSVQIRFWFYPDEIGAVTDGSIGVVRSYQFLADAERLDAKVKLDRPIRETIDHLNKNYAYYEKAEKTYEELDNVGRIMAIVNWLKEMKADDRIELDDLLSVKIPAFSTPEKTKKMLAVTAIAYPKSLSLSAQNVRDYTQTFYISDLLDKYPPTTSDEEYLGIANKYFEELGPGKLYPPEYESIVSQTNQDKKIINENNKKLDSIKAEIEQNKKADTESYNRLVTKYNNLLTTQGPLIDAYNSKIKELNALNIRSRAVVSIGGGISLDPKLFKKATVDRNFSKIKDIENLKSRLIPFGRISTSGDWVRSNPTNGGARINRLPRITAVQ